MGKKDILKVECDINTLNLDILGFIDHNITVNVIKNSEIVEKRTLKLPKEIKNVLKCKNPRCITSIEQELPHVFVLTDPQKEIYRCQYCEEKYGNKDFTIKQGKKMSALALNFFILQEIANTESIETKSAAFC